MKIHILSDPGFPTSNKIRTQYFPYDTWKFVNYQKENFDLVHYGLEGSEVECKHYDLPKDVTEWNKEASNLIDKEKQPGDIILCFGGNTNELATQAHKDCYVVEPHIGYNTKAVFAPYKVFTSYAQLHYYYGTKNNLLDICWYDKVIPNAITPDEFDFTEKKEDYVLYMGRVIETKGIHVAIQATKATNKKLVIAGSPDGLKHLGYDRTPKHVECLGNVGVEERRKLLAKAECLIGPTIYIEPFGLMVVEAHMSGTPTITTDWGAFPETNINGVTGYRCRMFSDFIWALNNIDAIDKKQMYKRAVETYSDDVVYPQYTEYFKDIVRNNWYE